MIKSHWETVYQTKSPQQVSWTQERPNTSLEYITTAQLSLDAPLIDIGGGDSLLVDYLLDLGYTDLSVLDISGEALKRAQKRLGPRAHQVQWITSNIVDFKPERPYALWHDRAAFHFLTHPEDIEHYKNLTSEFVQGHLVIGTFSKEGPLKCSGLEITQYNPEDLLAAFAPKFESLGCKTETHTTPFNTQQHFSFCHLKRINSL